MNVGGTARDIGVCRGFLIISKRTIRVRSTVVERTLREKKLWEHITKSAITPFAARVPLLLMLRHLVCLPWPVVRRLPNIWWTRTHKNSRILMQR